MSPSAASTRLLLIRHGETDWNRQVRFQGQLDVPLNDMGHTQAQRLGQHLAQEKVDRLLCSDLQRAQQTAQPLAQAWGLQPSTHVELREQHFGEIEGLEVRAVIREQPALWAQWLEHRGDFAMPGGETLQAFHARVWRFVNTLASQHLGQTLAIVTHGGVLDMLWRTARGEPIQGLRECHIPNTGINWMRWVPEQLHIEAWGLDEHLAGLPPQPRTNIEKRPARSSP